MRVATVPDRWEREARGPLECRGDVLVGVCPLPSHRHGNRPNLQQFRAERRGDYWLWHCFGCQRGGDVISFARAMANLDNRAIGAWLAEHFGDRALGRTTAFQTFEPIQERHTATSRSSAQWPSTISDAHRADSEDIALLPFRLTLDPDVPYLWQRGVSPSTIERNGIGLARRGVLRGYIGIPVYRWPCAAEEHPVAYLGRWPGEPPQGKPRYLWPRGFRKSRFIFGMQQALDSTDGLPLIVVEGPFDVFALYEAGYPTAVAVFGSSVSPAQANILLATGRQIVVLFDGDEAGRNGTRQARSLFGGVSQVRFVSIPDGTQPEHLSRDQLAELLWRLP